MEAARLACGIVSACADGDWLAARAFAPRAHLKGGRICDVLPFPAWELHRGQNRTVARWT